MTTDQRTFGGVGTKMLFENERIRVWEMRLAPGETSDLHEHHHDYAMIQIAGDRVAADFEPDSQDGWNGAEVGRVEGEVANGTVIFATKGGRERAVNIGRETFYEIIVELKD
jgi:hypothetical protein